METKQPPLETAQAWATLGEIAQMLGGQLEGPADLALTGVTAVETANPYGIGFAESEKFVQKAKESGVGALLLTPELDSAGIPCIRVPSPRQAFFALLTKAYRPWRVNAGIHAAACIDPEAYVAPTAQVGPFAVVEKGARVGEGARVLANAYIGEDCEVGAGCVIGPGVVLMQNVKIGDKTVIQPGAVLGADGFGYVWDGAKYIKIPQVGKVVIEDHVEIGALTAIDRAMAGETRVGSGTKLDNLIQVGHNTRIGKHTVIAALTGLSGTTTVGSRVVMGGQCATVDHAEIGDDISLAGRSGVVNKLTEPGEYFGAPPLPAKEGMRQMLLITRLSDLFKRLKAVERRLSKVDGESA